MNIKILLPIILCCSMTAQAQGQQTNPVPAPKNWTKTIGVGLSYNQTSLSNPPIGAGQNQIGANTQVNIALDYDRNRRFVFNSLQWNFGMLRFGSGPLAAGRDQKVPFQKALDLLNLNSLYGYRLSRDSTLSLLVGYDLQTQLTPSYIDPNGQLYGVFFKDIRNSNSNPIRSSLFAPARMTAYMGVGYRPSVKFFVGYSPLSYKGIWVFNDAIASLVGTVNATTGLPTATVHGNPVEIVNGKAVFKNAFNQFGSYFLAQYNDRYAKGRFGLSSKIQLYSNYLKEPQNLDVYWQNKLDFQLIKGLSLAYQFDLFYDHDVLVAISDRNVPSGLSGEYGRRVALLRQFLVKYQVSF